jgi:hypothetical protein
MRYGNAALAFSSVAGDLLTWKPADKNAVISAISRASSNGVWNGPSPLLHHGRRGDGRDDQRGRSGQRKGGGQPSGVLPWVLAAFQVAVRAAM